MKRVFNQMVLFLLIVVIFLFVSMRGLNYMLRIREKQLLTESGNAVVELPVQKGQEETSGNSKKDETSNGNNSVLTVRQVEDAIQSWNNRLGEMVHEPVEGQISMWEAIETGKQWIIKMGLEEEKEIGSYPIKATLSVGRQKEPVVEKLEPYYSFWTVQVVSQTMDAVLYLNAFTGNVWSGEITQYHSMPEKLPYEKIGLFLELAGLQGVSTEFIKQNSEGTQTMLAVEDSLLYAQVRYSNRTIDENSIVNYSDSGAVPDQYTIIRFDLTTIP